MSSKGGSGARCRGLGTSRPEPEAGLTARRQGGRGLTHNGGSSCARKDLHGSSRSRIHCEERHESCQATSHPSNGICWLLSRRREALIHGNSWVSGEASAMSTATQQQRRSPLGLFPDKSAPRLYDRIVEVLRVRHYSRRTEEAAGRAKGQIDQAGHEPHVSAFVCDTPFGRWLRHPHGARTAGPQRRSNDVDLHPHPEPRRTRRPQSCRRIGSPAR